MIHPIPRLNRINTSINDHRFLLPFLLPSSIRRLYFSSNSPNIYHIPFLSFSFPSFPHFNRENKNCSTTRRKITKNRWPTESRLVSNRIGSTEREKSENIARLDSCRRRVEGTGENDEAADSTEPRDERIREAAASTRVSRTPVRQCSRPSSLHLEEGRSCPKVVPPGRGEGGTPRPPSSNKMEVFSRFQLRLPWSTHVVSPLL